jgi:hypothetical protein
MIEKDYILRILQQFFEDLNTFINRKNKKDLEEDIVSFYNTYVGDYSFYHTAEINNIINSLDKYTDDEKLYRMQILAELFLQEAQLKTVENTKYTLLKKSLTLWECIDSKSNTYSIERIKKIEFIRSKLHK